MLRPETTRIDFNEPYLDWCDNLQVRPEDYPDTEALLSLFCDDILSTARPDVQTGVNQLTGEPVLWCVTYTGNVLARTTLSNTPTIENGIFTAANSYQYCRKGDDTHNSTAIATWSDRAEADMAAQARGKDTAYPLSALAVWEEITRTFHPDQRKIPNRLHAQLVITRLDPEVENMLIEARRVVHTAEYVLGSVATAQAGHENEPATFAS